MKSCDPYRISLSDTAEALAILRHLVEFPSVTPRDLGCQAFVANYLEDLGFDITYLPFGKVQNFFAKRGESEHTFVFAGHTDVVPVGDSSNWRYPPFEVSYEDGMLYGRGVADMKGSIAAMLVACKKFLIDTVGRVGSIAFLMTGDEEGDAIDGTRRVISHLKEKGEQFTWCLIGEPSSSQQLGDTLKVGRRGSLSANLKILGKQGHIAYPHLAKNPIHLVLPALTELSQMQWDTSAPLANFPHTSFQISNIQAGVGVHNVIPETLELMLNFRYAPPTTAEALKAKLTQVLETNKLDYSMSWQHSARPFWTKPDSLCRATCTAIEKVMQISPLLSTGGGTSDGRFIADMDCEIVEFGPVNASIHQINESLSRQAFFQLISIYYAILKTLWTDPKSD